MSKQKLEILGFLVLLLAVLGTATILWVVQRLIDPAHTLPLFPLILGWVGVVAYAKMVAIPTLCTSTEGEVAKRARLERMLRELIEERDHLRELNRE